MNEKTRPKVVVTAALMQYFLFLQQANKRRRTRSAGDNDDNDDNGDNDESGIVSILKCERIS